MKRIVIVLLAGLTLAIGNIIPASAHARAHITCENAGACVVTHYNGYYMARRYNDPTGWVRLTYVPGANNFHVSPIECPSGGSSGPGTCTIAYSSAQRAWYGREYLSSVSYRLTLVNGS